MKLCRGCNQEKNNFSKNARKPDGLQARCKDCCKAYDKVRYETREEFRKDVKKRNKDRRQQLQRIVIEHLQTHPCVDCGEADIVVLEFDHVRGKKVMSVSELISRVVGVEKLMVEMGKCDVRCCNCHRRATAKRAKTWIRLVGKM